MKQQFPLLMLLVLCFQNTPAHAEEVWSKDIGGTRVFFMPPPGFVSVTSDMPHVHRFLSQLQNADSEMVNAYIPLMDGMRARWGELPKIDRYYIVTVNRKTKDRVINTAEFARLRSFLDTEAENNMAKVQKEIPGMSQQVSGNLSREFNTNINVGISQLESYRLHLKEDHIFAYSLRANYQISGNQGSSQSMATMTTTVINPAGKVLFITLYDHRQDLEWTRSSSEKWGRILLRMNPAAPVPPSAVDRIMAVLPAGVSKTIGGIHWGRVGVSAAIGASVSIALALLRKLPAKKRKKKKKSAKKRISRDFHEL